MNVTGIEVVKRPDVAASGAIVGEKVELTYDDTLRVNVSFDYRGNAGSTKLSGAIGQRRGLPLFLIPHFDAILENEVSIELPSSPTDFILCQRSVDIPITSEISPGVDYDLSAKFPEYPEVEKPEVLDVIDIVGIPPTYELLQHTIYPYAYVYDGDVEVTAATFKTDPFTPSAWAAQKFADALESEVEKEGGRVIELKVYVDKTPLLWTVFRIEVVSTPLGGAVRAAPGIAVGIPIWAAILIVALAIIAVIVVATLAIKTITELFKHKPISEELKLAMSEETLIRLIGDFELKLERTPTPAAELEQMSHEELRVYCDSLAEEIVPPEIAWLPLVIVGGLGILGIGVAVLALPKE